MLRQPGGTESASGRQNVSLGPSLPEGVEYLCPTYGGALLGPRTCRVQGNEIADELARGGSALEFPGLEPALGVSTQ